MLRAKAVKPSLIQEADFREITRYPELCLTVVYIQLGEDPDPRTKWLVCGQTRLISTKDRFDGTWRLEAYLPAGVTDFEHDSAYAFKLPLIGVQFGSVEYHQTILTAWVDPNADGYFKDFNVPRAGYNPMKLPGAELCDLGEHGYTCNLKPHMIVPEKHYVPPFDAELYEVVKGKKVRIVISPVFPKEDE
jgi:hypothetical protein